MYELEVNLVYLYDKLGKKGHFDWIFASYAQARIEN